MTQDTSGSAGGTTTAPASGSTGGGAGSAPELVGTVLAGRYRILEKLGEGAMGAVYLGEHVRMGRRDAIKVLLGPLSKDPEAVARFNRGARNVAQVHHPNVCTVYDFSDTAEGLTFMAMELIVGESLKDLLQREHTLPPERAVAIARQTADALQAAHDAGIVHRDLKPGNIMLTRGRDGSDVVKVVDFDIAKGQAEAEGAELTRVGFVVGTPEYMSPEQLIGDRLDGRSDLYSLGLCLFRMLTGTLPFRADNPQDLMVQRLTLAPLRLEEAAAGKGFAPGLQVALDRALARKAAERQASAGEFGREIVAALAAPAGTPPPRPAESAVPPTMVAPAAAAPVAAAAPAAAAPGTGGKKRRPVAALGGGAALLILVGAVAWLARGRPPAPSPTSAAPAPTQSGSASPAGAAPAPAGGTLAAAPAATSPAAEQAGAANPAPGRSAAGATPGGRAADAGAPTTRAPAGPGAAGAVLSAGNANAILWRQFDRIGPPYPATRQVLAIRDTAGAFLDMEGLADKERALAAFIMAHTYIAMGEDNRVLPLLQRAVALDPGNSGYRTKLDDYRRRQQP